MITIQTYFDNIQKLEGLQARFDAEDAAWGLFENDSNDFSDWLKMADIDPDATKLINGQPVKYLDLWCWDMDDE